MAYRISGLTLTIAAVLAIITTLDVFARTQSDNSLLSNLPICFYLSLGVDDYSNTDCKTLPMILDAANQEKDKIEKNVISNLVLLVPKRLQSIDILSSPKVRFIQEHTGDSRISINDAINRFLDIKSRTLYQGEDIDCQNIIINEKGKITMSCDIYGSSLTNPSQSSIHTSRETTLSFLNNLLDPKSGFQVLSYPKTLDVNSFSSTELGLKSVFSTKTTIELTLQYLPINKM